MLSKRDIILINEVGKYGTVGHTCVPRLLTLTSLNFTPPCRWHLCGDHLRLFVTFNKHIHTSNCFSLHLFRDHHWIFFQLKGVGVAGHIWQQQVLALTLVFYQNWL